MMIQSSYANPLKQCNGIQMEWISSFKHEREMLLYNQHLPIQKTEIVDDDPTILMNHFIHSLLSRELLILKKEIFYKQLGVAFDPKWIPSIMKHRLLLAKSKCSEFRLIDRLANELNITFFRFSKIFSNAADTEDDILFLKDIKSKPDAACAEVSRFTFTRVLGPSSPNHLAVEFQFDDIEEFCIPCVIYNHYRVGEYVILAAGRVGLIKFGNYSSDSCHHYNYFISPQWPRFVSDISGNHILQKAFGLVSS